MYLLIAEKPSLMKELLNVYKKHKKEINKDIEFIALAGHVCRLAEPSEYDGWDKKWRELKLPIIPSKWKIENIKEKSKIVSDIKKNMGKYDGFICATDSDREGNAIFALLSEKVKFKKPIYRLWIHDLTEEAILNAFLNMVDFNKNTFQKNLTNAAILRGRMDWLIGMNSTIGATISCNELLKIGRVKTPTLKLVYDNCMAIDNFEPSISYGVDAICSSGFKGAYKEDFSSLKDASEFASAQPLKILITEAKENKVTTEAPALYKLSDLQIEANKLYKYSPDKTLELVQNLYERHKLVSYPRTDCRFVSSAMAKDFNTLFKPLEAHSELLKFVKGVSSSDIERASRSSKYVSDKEVNKSSHTALIPTKITGDLTKLSMDEFNILTMIYKRFLSIFLPPCIEQKTSILTDNNFVFKFNKVEDIGYKILYKEKNDNSISINIKQGDTLDIKEYQPKKKTTKPPIRLTEGSLISEMENIGKYIDNKELKDVMKEVNSLGTPATRGAIIKSLIKDGYMETKKDGLHITDKGSSYINKIKDKDICSPEFTATWEEKLHKVELGEESFEHFEFEMNNYVKEVIKNFKS